MTAALAVEHSTAHTFNAAMRCRRCGVPFDDRGPTCRATKKWAFRRRDSLLRTRRRELRMTQAELGWLLGVSEYAVANWERGSAIPFGRNARRLERALGYPLQELLPVAAAPDVAVPQ